MRHRPLLAPALAFATGIFLGAYWTPPWWILAGGSLGCLVAGALVWLNSPRISPTPSLLAASVLLGWWHYTSDIDCLALNDIRRLTRPEPVLGTFRVQLRESPKVRVVDRQGNLTEQSVVRARLIAWQPDFGDWQSASGDIVISTRDVPGPNFFRGQTAELSGVLRAPPGPAAPGLFDYAQFLRQHRIFRQLIVESEQDWLPGPNPRTRLPWSERFLPWAHAVLQAKLPQDEASGLLRSMTLGWRTALTGEIREDLMRAGTLHVFAISGLHITLVSSILVLILRLLRLPRFLCALLAIPLTWFYVAATGWPASGIRAATMSSVFMGGWLCQRPSDPLNSLAVAAWILLVWQPGQLFLAGFQFSFCVVASLITSVYPLQNWLLSQVRLDPFLPDELRPKWQLMWLTPLRWILSGLVGTWVAWLASIPLTVQHFHLINPVSPWINLLALPLASLTLGSCLLCLMTAPIAEWLSDWFRSGAWFWMTHLHHLSERASQWPLAWFPVAPPPAYCWIAVPILWLMPWYWTRCCRSNSSQFIRHRIAFTGWILVGLILGPGGWWLSRWTQRDVFRWVFPASGESALLLTPTTRESVLFNSGSPGHVVHVLDPLLRFQGYRSSPIQIITQPENRFVGGAPLLLLQHPPPAVSVPAGKHRSPIFRSYLAELKSNSIPVHPLQNGDEFLGWSVLNPTLSTRYTRADENALVLYRVLHGWGVLWLSGLGPRAQQNLMKHHGHLAVDILIAGIPSQGEPVIPELLEGLRPQVLILLSGHYPAQNRLNPTTRQRLTHGPWHFLATKDVGYVELKITPNYLRIRSGFGDTIEMPTRSF